MVLTTLGQYVNEMMAVAVKIFQNFLCSRFLIIRQNVNMATNAILYCGLTPIILDEFCRYILHVYMINQHFNII